jgi:putative oxidoreductase
MNHASIRFQNVAYNVLRIAAGLMFFVHGTQKLFGWFTAQGPVQLPSEFGVAGVLETFGGLAIVLGLFTRPVALVLSGEMAVAYFWKHSLGNGSIWWWENGGELAALYSFLWLFFAAFGGVAFSLDALIKRKKKSG